MSLSEIGISLGISILGDLITIPAKEIWKRLTKPEYAKYKNCFKPPFISAFKKTLDIFHDKNITPYIIPDGLYNKLSELDDIAVGIIFQDIKIDDIPYNGNNLYMVLTDKLKRYCVINGFNIEDIFYEYWKDVFAKEYERCFKLFFAIDDPFRQDVLVNIFSISTEKLNTLAQGQMDIKQDIASAKNEILESNFSILNKMEKLQSSIPVVQIIKEIDEDCELKKVRDLIDQYNYEECISYISLNINDNWKNKPSVFRAKMYNMLGNCYQNLNDHLNAKSAYKTSIEIDSEIEAPLYNLANIAMEEDDEVAYLECFAKFNNTSSELYFKLKFFKYLFFDKEFKLAEDCLEVHLINVEDYLFLKAMLFLRNSHGNDTQKVEHYLQEYINKTKDNTTVPRYNLVNCQFSDLFNKSKVQFLFDINIDGQLKVNHNLYEIENIDEAKLLLDNLNQTYDGLCKIHKNHKNLLLTIKIKIFLVKYFIKEFNQEEINIDEINDFVINGSKLMDSPITEALILNILCNRYCEAHKIYDLLDNEAKKLNKNNYTIILFGEQKYEEVLKHIASEELFDELTEQFKIISLYKVEGWGRTLEYLRANQDKYSTQLLVLCIFLYHNNFCYDEELALLRVIAKEIIEKPEQYSCHFVYNIAHNLAFYKNESNVDKLRRELIEKYWTKAKSQKNFDIGLIYAVDLYNSGLYSKCLNSLEILKTYEPDNETIKNLYAYIDAVNYNPDTLVENFEKGRSKEEFLPFVAQSYISKKEYSKAKNIIDSLKYLKNFKLQYYYLRTNLQIAQKVEHEIIIEGFVQALEEYPDDLQLNSVTLNFLLISPVVNDVTRKIFAQCSNVLKRNNLIHEIKLDMSNPIESLTQAIEKFEPHKKYLEREKFYENALENYNNFVYPLTLTAEAFGIKPSTLFADFLENPKQIIALTRCVNEQQTEEIKWINKNTNIIVSPQTLILLKKLEIDETVFSNLKIKITAQTKEEFNFILNDATESAEQRMVRDKNGKPHIVYTRNEILEYKSYLKECLNSLSVAKFNSRSTTALPLIEASEKNGFNKLFFDGIVSLQNNYLTCSSDMVTNILSKEFKFKDVTILSIINYLYQKNIISNKKVSELKYKLLELNCKYVSFSALDLYYNVNSSIDKFKNILCYLDEKFDKDSVVLAMSFFVYMINRNKGSAYNKICEIMDLIFNKCAQLDRSDAFIKLFAEDAMKYYHLLDDIIQKYFSYKLWNAISDKRYIETYYEYMMICIAGANSDIGNNIRETKRIAFNSPKNLQQKLQMYSDFLINKYL